MKNRILVLAGSGEFSDQMEQTDKFLINEAKNNFNLDLSEKIKVAIIPTAASRESDYYKWIKMGMNHFTKLGSLPSGFEVLSKKDANSKKFFDRIKSFHFIYFSGGDPGHLFETIFGSLFWETIYKLYLKGAILAGSSAGAMVMGKYVFSNAKDAIVKNAKPDWIKGFNLVPYAIIPHYDYVMKSEKKKFMGILDKSPVYIKENLIGIDEDTTLILYSEKEGKVLGKGKVYLTKNGRAFL